MPWLRAHLTAVLAVVVLVTAGGGVMTLARPASHAAADERIVDVSKGPHLSPAEVVRAFAAHGIRLTRTAGNVPGATSFTDVHPGSTLDDGFLVTVWDPTATVHVSTAGTIPRFERWVGNVDVYYGGLSYTLAARAEAAAGALAR